MYLFLHAFGKIMHGFAMFMMSFTWREHTKSILCMGAENVSSSLARSDHTYSYHETTHEIKDMYFLHKNDTSVYREVFWITFWNKGVLETHFMISP